MSRSDNEVKQVLLQWLKKANQWEQYRADVNPERSQKHTSGMIAEGPARSVHRKKYTWDQLWRDLPDERFVGRAWVSQAMEETKNPPSFCKSWKHKYYVCDGEINEFEEPEGGYGTYYLHPDAWDLADKLKKVMKTGFDTVPYYDSIPAPNMKKGREFLVFVGEDYTSIECRYRKNFLYKRVPSRLANSVQLYAKTYNRLFPSLEVVVDPPQKNNVHWHNFL